MMYVFEATVGDAYYTGVVMMSKRGMNSARLL